MAVDTFGPWLVAFRQIRGRSAEQKRLELIFTCLVTRAIDTEIMEQLSSSSFINLPRRFVALQGPVSQFRSGHGTILMGATEDSSIKAEFIDKRPVSGFLSNSPHAPDMDGV